MTWYRYRVRVELLYDMPYHFEFDVQNRILLLVLEGEVRGQDLEGMNEEILERVIRLSPLAGISDFSAVLSFDVPTHSLQNAALQPSPYPEPTPRFIVAPTDYLFGMARMYELIANRPASKLRVVRSREEALAALAVKEPKFERVE